LVCVIHAVGFVYISKCEEVLAMSRTETPGICRWYILNQMVHLAFHHGMETLYAYKYLLTKQLKYI